MIEEIRKLKIRNNELMKHSNTDRKRELECFYCKKRGHMKHECNQLAADRYRGNNSNRGNTYNRENTYNRGNTYNSNRGKSNFDRGNGPHENRGHIRDTYSNDN